MSYMRQDERELCLPIYLDLGQSIQHVDANDLEGVHHLSRGQGPEIRSWSWAQ